MRTKMILGLLLCAALFGCKEEAGFQGKNEISVISREQGSGTRDAFVELTGVLEKKDGKKVDNTTRDALIIDGTQAVMSNVAFNEYAIGYISLGSLNSTVKALDVNGIKVSAENVKNGTYPIARPFNVAYKTLDNEILKDFLAFILSEEGSTIIAKNGYVPVSENPKKYESNVTSGKLVIAGSSSVSPVMEKLKEAYQEKNKGIEIEIQTNDSSSGMLAAKEGSCDLGMASRNLKSSESSVLTSLTIAMDGIAVIVNSKNPVKNLDLNNIKSIFTGNAKTWEAFLAR